MAGEFDFIQWLESQQQPSALVRLGIGDDLAVLNWPRENMLIAGVDQVLDGVHFDSSIHTPRQIGRKVMNRNLSDCAAMACLPVAALPTVAVPRGTSLEYAKQLFLGLRDAADPFDCRIVGGDTASWPGKLAMTVTILCRNDGIDPVSRAGAKPGDLICVTGPLGGSILGRHMNFVPQVAWGRALAKSATAMIDISDGLSRDLPHICKASGVGAIVFEDQLPIHDDAVALSRRDGISALEHALIDGEDYELLFTCAKLPGGLEIPIGRITDRPGIFLEHRDGTLEPLRPRGWEHRL